jgi:hypothetical protein
MGSILTKAATYYVATNGNDNNPGTISAPFASWSKLSSVLRAGDIAYIRGGTYRSTAGAGASVHCLWQNLQGTSSSPIKIYAYNGEFPVFNLDNISPTNSDPTAVVMDNCRYVEIKGLRITGLKQISSGSGVSRGFDFRNSPNNKIEFVELDHIGGYGYILSNGSSNNYFLNCDAHHMDDRYTNDGGAWGNANGFQCTGGSTATNITFENCRAWWISDDGFDLYGVDGVFTFKNCWSFWNGYNPGTFTKVGDGDGFKLGPSASGSGTHNSVLRTVSNCIAFENANSGFDQNNGDLRVKMYNNTSYSNKGQFGYMWDYISPAPSQDFKNNVSFMDNNPRRGAETNGSNNSWNGIITVKASDFLSTSSSGVDGARQSDGSLPYLNFLRPSAASALINTGLNIGLNFLGSAPDMGAFESGSGGSANTPPTANAGSDISITLPVNTASLTGSGSDPGGSVTAYAWSKVSGPSAGTLSNASAANASLSGLVQGVYVYRLTVTDNNGATGYADVSVTVNAAASSNFTANAGADKTVTLPANSVSLAGSASISSGSVTGYAWTKIAGPSSGSISSASSATTNVTGLVQGTYKFELKATSNTGLTARDTAQVTVNAASSGSTTTGTLKTIQVNIYKSVGYNNSQWNNWTPVSGRKSSSFKYTDGSSGSVTALISAQNQVYDNGSNYLSTATICPPNVLRYASSYNGSRTITIYGLNASKKYSFALFTSATVSNTQATFIINGWPYVVPVTNNKNSYAEYINVSPTSSGTVVITLKNTQGKTTFLNAFTVVEQTGTVTSFPSSARTISGTVASTHEAIDATNPGPEASGIAATSAISIRTYPVPFSSSFSVSISAEVTGKFIVDLLDMTGKLISTKTVTKSGVAVVESVYLGNLPAGAYILRVTDPNGNQSTQQIVKN